MFQKLTELRKELHSQPELSGREDHTAKKIAGELKNCNPDTLLQEVGGNGVMALFRAGNQPAESTILFRAELDAIAVKEQAGVSHASKNSGVMHGCGHDGHMATLVGLARLLKQHRPERCDVLTLFQPAEETGEGSGRVMADSRFSKLNITHGFAFHNLPGYREQSVIIRDGVFASASVGMEITLKGRFSHAAFPEEGVNPSEAVADLVQTIHRDMKPFTDIKNACKYAVTYINMGEVAYGISPGEAVMGVTVRAATDNLLLDGIRIIESAVAGVQNRFEGSISWKRKEPFAATINSKNGVNVVKQAAKNSGLSVVEKGDPFPWSEDFGAFRKQFPITLFGLGAGEDHTVLHSENYDYNDILLKPGVKLFVSVIDCYSHGFSDQLKL